MYFSITFVDMNDTTTVLISQNYNSCNYYNKTAIMWMIENFKFRNTIYLIMILHKLYNDSNVIRVVLDRNNSHDVSSVFSIRILTVLIG